LSEMTSLRQWLALINYNHGTTEYRGIFPRYFPCRKISGTAQHYYGVKNDPTPLSV